LREKPKSPQIKPAKNTKKKSGHQSKFMIDGLKIVENPRNGTDISLENLKIEK